MVIWVVGQPACLVPRPPLASSILQLWVAKHTQTYHHGPRYLSRLETAPNNHLASKLLNRKSTCIKSFCHMMNYDTSLCSQHVYSFRAPKIRNIWLFRRYVSYLALSNSTDVDSRDNSEYTRVCLYVMCDMKCVFLFLHLSFGRAALRRPLISLSPPASSVLCCSACSLCAISSAVDSSVLSSVKLVTQLDNRNIA